ncbi:helix-turn-helix domain-containing protein [Parabacteroides sp. W1-Q-101]|uniref:helix-turn-helix transcriptional regulator n=1 Tax=Parabacteroides caeci TaxID=2949650 RepID=UPI0020309933|nr:helix-turn-helix transcriptional regulator [Parabacteroides sp. W1-Q-101]MCM0717365.1 helix-turn-helix domain-containing protein [Parabacteroides sp. W1-Q-101]DAZ06898.1 MAG TPA: helix-turn-helix domain protein [Caudoviricetes sp.]
MKMIRGIIKKAIADKGVKPVDLANKIEISRSSMSLFINGKINLSLPKIEKIFEVLGIRLEID